MKYILLIKILLKKDFILYFLSLFFKIILKNNIYNHQILSFFGLILIFIPTILKIKKGDIIINIIFFFIIYLYIYVFYLKELHLL